MTKTTARPVRTTRKSLQDRGPQAISGIKDPNYEYRFVNDNGSRLHLFQQAGYEFVKDEDMIVGSSRVSDVNDLGSNKSVISNDGTTSYLMRIKKEFYDEDQAAKAEAISEQESAMKSQATQGMYGKLTVS